VLKRFLIFLLFASPTFAVSARTADYDVQAETEIINLINKERTDRGMGALHLDNGLTIAARRHTDLMIEHHELTHKISDEPVLRNRLADAGAVFDIAGENVAYDWSPQHAHVEFMHSPGHRANILNPKFTAVGLGVKYSGNVLWVTEDFSKSLGTTSASEAANMVREKYNALRKKEGSPAAKEQPSPALGKVACEMASKDKLDTQSARKIKGIHGVMAWTATDPGKLPEQVKQLADDRTSVNYSLGVCFASSDSYPNKVFWMVMAVY
jgi:hypothetical protein